MQAAAHNDTVAHPVPSGGLEQLSRHARAPPRVDQHPCRCAVMSTIYQILFPHPTGQSLTNNNPWGADHPLTKHLRRLISTSLAQATKNTYPLTPSSCRYHLHRLLSQAGYRPDHFNTHSFRVGATTSAGIMGASSRAIKRLGHWRLIFAPNHRTEQGQPITASSNIPVPNHTNFS